MLLLLSIQLLLLLLLLTWAHLNYRHAINLRSATAIRSAIEQQINKLNPREATNKRSILSLLKYTRATIWPINRSLSIIITLSLVDLGHYSPPTIVSRSRAVGLRVIITEWCSIETIRAIDTPTARAVYTMKQLSSNVAYWPLKRAAICNKIIMQQAYTSALTLTIIASNRPGFICIYK